MTAEQFLQTLQKIVDIANKTDNWRASDNAIDFIFQLLKTTQSY